MGTKPKILFFSGQSYFTFAKEVLSDLGEYLGKDLKLGEELKFSHINIASYSDGESDLHIPNFEKINGNIVVLNQSIFKREFLEETLELAWAIKHQYKASHLIAVIPFMMFRRQDHEEKMEEICRLKMIIDRLKHAGIDEIITVTPHSSKMKEFCDEYKINLIEVDPTPLFAETIEPYVTEPSIYSPDKGSIVRAIKLAKLTNSKVIFSLKKRGLNNEALIKPEEKSEIAETIAYFQEKFNFPEIYYADTEHINGQSIVIVEDEISTGGTANKTGKRLKDLGAKLLLFLAVHPVLSSDWRRKLIYDDNPFSKIILCNTIPRNYDKATGGYIHDVSVSKLVAKALFKSLQAFI